MAKILVTIPHYYLSDKKVRHGSAQMGDKQRIKALTSCLFNLYSLFSSSVCMFDTSNRRTIAVNQDYTHQINVVICTANGKHLLKSPELLDYAFEHRDLKMEDPRFLGFECQKVLKENFGNYDYYCYMEDDLLIHDPYFFEKIAWFNKATNNECVLIPKMYEVSTRGQVLKAYVDGNIVIQATEKYQNIRENYELSTSYLNNTLSLIRACNPHSGCFFLNKVQMEKWLNQPYFLDLDTGFVSPLESAACVGLMKTFRVYKPHPKNASFLEIQHFGDLYLLNIGQRIAMTH